MNWDDKKGPYLEDHYPKTWQSHDDIEKVGFQLFNTIQSIYGQYSIHEGQGIRLNIDNLQKEGYVFFDSIVDMKVRGRERPFMLGVIAPKINYFESVKIGELFKATSHEINEGLDWNLEHSWEKILKILSTSLL